jgi:type IV pilus assembly protein PilC
VLGSWIGKRAVTSNYCYEAVNAGGLKLHGILDVPDQGEALRRIKEMGLFPVKVAEARRGRSGPAPMGLKSLLLKRQYSLPFIGGRVKPAVLAVFTRQLATLIEAGMPLLRGLRTLQEQESSATLKRTIEELAESIEGGSSLSEAMAAHPRVFNPLYTNMTKAGELAGALEVTFRRLAEFMERGRKIRGKVKAALYYPAAVLTIALIILWAMMVYIIPRFQQAFEGLLTGVTMPRFTLFVIGISQSVRDHFLSAVILGSAFLVAFLLAIHTRWGRRAFDRLKLSVPILGPVFRKLAVSRFARTLGTLLNNGVPIL